MLQTATSIWTDLYEDIQRDTFTILFFSTIMTKNMLLSKHTVLLLLSLGFYFVNRNFSVKKKDFHLFVSSHIIYIEKDTPG
jgi:hypothetical protein